MILLSLSLFFTLINATDDNQTNGNYSDNNTEIRQPEQNRTTRTLLVIT